MKSGYHQLTLAPECRYITTFATHKGLRRYKRLNFGTNAASEIFQSVIHDQIRDIPGVLNISDDVIVFGKDQEAHDTALQSVFEQFAKVGLTLNSEKCLFNQKSLTYFGFVFSAQGLSPNPHKVKAIQEAPPPTSAKAVRSFLGMASYCSRFIHNFSHLADPLRELTKKDVTFKWTGKHDNAFKQLKAALTSSTVMSYFDPEKETEVVTDASPYGLSAILTQTTPGQDDRKVIAYVSRSLTPVERRYSQTERKALAIVWAVERLHTYLYGSSFTLYAAIRIITNSAYDVSVGPLLKQLQLPSISDMIKQESASMVYKALNAEAPIYLAEQFTRVSDITSRTLRSSNLSLRPPRLKSRNGQNCFAYRGSYIWNSLSSEIKSSRTYGSFQTKLKAMLAETN